MCALRHSATTGTMNHRNRSPFNSCARRLIRLCKRFRLSPWRPLLQESAQPKADIYEASAGKSTLTSFSSQNLIIMRNPLVREQRALARPLKISGETKKTARARTHQTQITRISRKTGGRCCVLCTTSPYGKRNSLPDSCCCDWSHEIAGHALQQEAPPGAATASCRSCTRYQRGTPKT